MEFHKVLAGIFIFDYISHSNQQSEGHYQQKRR